MDRMNNKRDTLDAYIDSAAVTLGIPSTPPGSPPYAPISDVTFTLAALVGEKELPDDAESAPVFKA